MFREMRRLKQALTAQQCREVLDGAPRGVLAVHGEDGYPYAFPMDFARVGDKLYFHCAQSGHKLDAIRADSRVSFCVMDEGFRREGEWALNIRSVILFGRIAEVTDPAAARQIAQQIGAKYYPTPEEAAREVEKDFHRVCILELSVDQMTGKLVNES